MEEMSVGQIVLLGIAGTLLFIISIMVRSRTGNRYEVKGIDLALIFIPFFVWMLVTGRIEKIAVGGVEVDVAQAFVAATTEPIELQVNKTSLQTVDDVVRTVERSLKSGTDRIPELIENKTEALEFNLDYGGYWGPAIQQYFESLSAYSFLKYAIIHEADGTLFGIYDARSLLQYFRGQHEGEYSRFAKSLIRGDDAAKAYLRSLPGFLGGERAVTAAANKREVLKQMEHLNLEVLPVVDAQGRFLGVVERARLTASLMIDVAERLENLGSTDGG